MLEIMNISTMKSLTMIHSNSNFYILVTLGRNKAVNSETILDYVRPLLYGKYFWIYFGVFLAIDLAKFDFITGIFGNIFRL